MATNPSRSSNRRKVTWGGFRAERGIAVFFVALGCIVVARMLAGD
jgi:hypothetical protein